MAHEKATSTDVNADPITGEPGAHPVGVGVGAAGGGAAGAAIGAIGGPIGVAAGAAIGAIAGGLAGKAAAEAIDPTAEDAYWRAHYKDRPYVEPTADYGNYQPAYQYGWESRGRHADRNFDEVEPQMREGWTNMDPATNTMSWEEAKHAARDAWDHAGQTRPNQPR